MFLDSSGNAWTHWPLGVVRTRVSGHFNHTWSKRRLKSNISYHVSATESHLQNVIDAISLFHIKCFFDTITLGTHRFYLVHTFAFDYFVGTDISFPRADGHKESQTNTTLRHLTWTPTSGIVRKKSTGDGGIIHLFCCSMFTSDPRGSAPFCVGQLYKKCKFYSSLNWVWKLLIRMYSRRSLGSTEVEKCHYEI